MALLKQEPYGGAGYQVDLGQTVDDVQVEQLNISAAEMLKAINQENLTDRIFARILKNRSKSHGALLAAVPGASTESK